MKYLDNIFYNISDKLIYLGIDISDAPALEK